MIKDYSPYMIPNLSGSDEMQQIHQDNTRREFDHNRPYLKSATADAIAPQRKELQELLTTTNAAYIANFKVDSRIPYHVHHSFDRDMELFSQSLAEQVADTYGNALDRGMAASKAVIKAYGDIESGLHTLSAKLNRYDREFSTWLALESFQQQGYTRYLFISEQGQNTCDRCLAYHGRVFSIADVPIPPLHPNCRCELLVMDARTEALYHTNEQAFIERFHQIRSGTEGGVYLVDHEAFPFGVTPANLTRVSLPSGHMVVDLSRPSSWGENSDYDLATAAASYFSGLAAEAKDLIGYLLNAQAERSEHKWDSLGCFMDWLTLGIVSGTWRGIVSNYETMIEDPSLYNIVNFLTLGTLDTISGALSPEDPWSLEHWLDIIGTVLIVYSAYKTAVNVKEILTGSGDDALRAAGTLADDVDDIARNAGLTQTQIDDIIHTPKGQRPNPSTYLTQEYINQHLDMFRGGVTKFYATAPAGTVGPPDGAFVFPSSYADDIIAQAKGDVRVLEELLGFDSGDLGDSPVRIDISNPQGLRMPSGNERGVNDYWLPGGYTSGGIPEAIIDPTPSGQYTIDYYFLGGTD